MTYKIKICPSCGNKIIDGTTFCMHCGTKIDIQNKPEDKKYINNVKSSKTKTSIQNNDGNPLDNVISTATSTIAREVSKSIVKGIFDNNDLDPDMYSSFSNKFDKNIYSSNSDDKKLRELEHENDQMKEKIKELEERINNKKAMKVIDFNSASFNELNNLGDLSDIEISTILILRKNGITFNSFEDLKQKAEIDENTIMNLKKHVKFSTNVKYENEININKLKNRIENNQSENKKEINTSQEESNNTSDKIDINLANQEMLSQIPSINIIKAKKIIDLREQGIYIKSYDDLQDKLNLKPEQIVQIKDITTISEQDKKTDGRKVDL